MSAGEIPRGHGNCHGPPAPGLLGASDALIGLARGDACLDCARLGVCPRLLERAELPENTVIATAANIRGTVRGITTSARPRVRTARAANPTPKQVTGISHAFSLEIAGVLRGAGVPVIARSERILVLRFAVPGLRVADVLLALIGIRGANPARTRHTDASLARVIDRAEIPSVAGSPIRDSDTSSGATCLAGRTVSV